jgi:hypothetical protein
VEHTEEVALFISFFFADIPPSLQQPSHRRIFPSRERDTSTSLTPPPSRIRARARLGLVFHELHPPSRRARVRPSSSQIPYFNVTPSLVEALAARGQKMTRAMVLLPVLPEKEGEEELGRSWVREVGKYTKPVRCTAGTLEGWRILRCPSPDAQARSSLPWGVR